MRLLDLLDAARDLDSGAVAGIVVTLTARHGVAATWTGACVPALRRMAAGAGPADIAVEHALTEGIARGLDLASVPRHADIRSNHVLLACAPGEQHELPLKALAAALFERRVGTFSLGAGLPWPALHAATGRTAPSTAVIWAQTAETADAAGLFAVAADFAGTVFAAAGPGWLAAGVAPRLTRAGLAHLTSLDLAISACARVPEPLDMEA
ncbi:transcriptional regulator [Dactylosporangium sp. NPDC000244]|uniref:transcriptional regulator n=1 Tax=Dactylosporangium sp. NPDC000244 TaxID=3154365 RepID=UPI00331965BC